MFIFQKYAPRLFWNPTYQFWKTLPNTPPPLQFGPLPRLLGTIEYFYAEKLEVFKNGCMGRFSSIVIRS